LTITLLTNLATVGWAASFYTQLAINHSSASPLGQGGGEGNGAVLVVTQKLPAWRSPRQLPTVGEAGQDAPAAKPRFFALLYRGM
jgi:hypothetical protein